MAGVLQLKVQGLPIGVRDFSWFALLGYRLRGRGRRGDRRGNSLSEHRRRLRSRSRDRNSAGPDGMNTPKAYPPSTSRTSRDLIIFF